LRFTFILFYFPFMYAEYPLSERQIRGKKIYLRSYLSMLLRVILYMLFTILIGIFKPVFQLQYYLPEPFLNNCCTLASLPKSMYWCYKKLWLSYFASNIYWEPTLIHLWKITYNWVSDFVIFPLAQGMSFSWGTLLFSMT